MFEESEREKIDECMIAGERGRNYLELMISPPISRK
jgi:hypothetical protein